MDEKILLCIMFFSMAVITLGCTTNIQQDIKDRTSQPGDTQNLNIHQQEDYKLELCQNIGIKETRNGLSCECVEYPQLGAFWVCNNKVLCGPSYVSLDVFKTNGCTCLVPEIADPDCRVDDGYRKCGALECQKETQVFSRS